MPNEKPLAEIKSTTNYDMFESVLGNRQIKPFHLRRLKRSIKEKNLLPEKPINVTRDFEVIDGQHRLIAAKELAVPIYYKIQEDLTSDDIPRLNNAQLNWSTEDYLNYFIAQNKEEYIKCRKFMKEWKLESANFTATILSTNPEVKTCRFPRDAFVTGEFKVVDEDYAKELVEFWRVVSRYAAKSSIHRRYFLQTLHRILINEDVDMERLHDKIAEKGIVPTFDTPKEYLRFFEDLYMSGVGGPKKVRFFG